MKGKSLALTVLLQISMILALFFYNQYLKSTLQERELLTTPMSIYNNEETIYINYNISEIHTSKVSIDFNYKNENPRIVYLKLNNTNPAEVTGVTLQRPEGVFVKANFAGVSEDIIHVYFKNSKFENKGKLQPSDSVKVYRARVEIDKRGNIHIKELHNSTI